MKDQHIIKKNSDLIWTIANLLRGPYRPPQYRRVMIPLTVLRRLDCVLESSKTEVMKEYNAMNAQTKTDEEGNKIPRHTEETIEKIINKKFAIPFFNTSGFTFAKRKEGVYASLLDDPPNLAANLSKYISGFSLSAYDILEKFKFEEEIEKLEESNRLFQIIKEFAGIDLHPDRVPNMIMGYLFEDLVRRFNEEAGDHFTPREVINLMVHLLYTGDDIYDPGVVKTIYDPTCGTGGMLSVSQDYIEENNPKAHLELFGQEYNPEAYAICGSDLLIKGADVNNIVFGDTLGTGTPKEGRIDGDGFEGRQFHYMLANPPFGVEWKPEQDKVTREHNEQGFSGRFGPGLPRINDGALLFLLHMMSKMHPPPENEDDKERQGSRIGIVFNGSPLFTGDTGSGESNIRRWIIENDMLEAVVGLPNQMFYNTGIFTYIWIITNRKRPERKGKVQLIDATKCFVKMKKSLGNKRNEIGDGKDGKPNHIDELTALYGTFQDQDQKTFQVNGKKQIATSRIFNNQEFGYLKVTVERPLRLNFNVTKKRVERFKKSTYFTGLAVSKKRKDVVNKAKEEKKGLELQQAILKVLEALKPDFKEESPVKNRDVFEKQLNKAFKKGKVELKAPLKKALLSTNGLGVRDPTADVCLKNKKDQEPNSELRDTENVPFPADISLPLSLDYETARTKGKVDKTELLDQIKDHCEIYLTKEVIPYRPDAWIDFEKTKVGYEVPFTRHFYTYEPPRPLEEIEADIKGLESEIVKMLNEVTL